MATGNRKAKEPKSGQDAEAGTGRGLARAVSTNWLVWVAAGIVVVAAALYAYPLLFPAGPAANAAPSPTTYAPAPSPSVQTTAQPPTSSGPSLYRIDIFYSTFRPASLVIPAGSTVEWFNGDAVLYDIVSKSGPAAFDSGQLPGSRSFNYTFNVPGTYVYREDRYGFTGNITVT